MIYSNNTSSNTVIDEFGITLSQPLLDDRSDPYKLCREALDVHGNPISGPVFITFLSSENNISTKQIEDVFTVFSDAQKTAFLGYFFDSKLSALPF